MLLLLTSTTSGGGGGGGGGGATTAGLKACVLVVIAKAIGAGVQTVTNVVDQGSATFTPKAFIIIGNSARNTLDTYYRRSWGFDDGASFHRSTVTDEVTILGAKVVCRASSATAYSIMDHAASFFAGGTIQREAYISAVRDGEFDITYDLNLRTGDSFIVVALGGDDLTVSFGTTINPAARVTPFAPEGVIFQPHTSAGGTTTGASGNSTGIGWDTRTSGKGGSAALVNNQGSNARYQRSTVLSTTQIATGFSIESHVVNTWGPLGFTMDSASNIVMYLALGGTSIVAGILTEPVSTGALATDTGLENRLVLLSSVGLPTTTSLDGPEAQILTGMMTANAQAAYWAGENVIGNVTLHGARYLSNQDTILMGTPAAGATTFSTRAQSGGFSGSTFITSFSAVSGLGREFLYLAIGDTYVPPPVPTRLIFRLDSGEDASNWDDGDVFQAYVKTGAMAPSGQLNQMGEVRESYLVARPRAATRVQMTIHKDFEATLRTSLVDLSPVASETHVIRKFQDAAMADAAEVQLTLGDAQPTASSWALDRLEVLTEDEGEQ